MDRVEYEQHPVRHEYLLTDKGRDLTQVMVVLSAWGDRWLDNGKGAPIRLIHTECGHDAEERTVCGHCGDQLAASNLTAAAGPGFPSNGPNIFNRPA